jgi:hypothetical protein
MGGSPLRRRTVIGLAAAAVALMVGQQMTAGSAAAFDGPSGHHQFVQISTREAPNWGAEMDLYDWQGNLVHSWEYGRDGWKMGGSQTWWFTAGKGSRIEAYVTAADGIGLTTNEVRKTFWIEPGSPDGYCFHVSPLGSVKYTGDSNTGGCTPD